VERIQDIEQLEDGEKHPRCVPRYEQDAGDTKVKAQSDESLGVLYCYMLPEKSYSSS